MAPTSTMSGQRRVASRLTAQEKEIIDVSFDSFAEDETNQETGEKTRYIDTDKLREALKEVGDMTDIQLLIDDIDENGDGKIDVTEWTAIMSRKFLGEEDDSSFMHVFMMLDDNKDGYIPLVELRKMLMNEGQAPLSEQEIDELMMFADLDCDGLVNYRQFLRWLSAPEVYAKAHTQKLAQGLTQSLDSAVKNQNVEGCEYYMQQAKAYEAQDPILKAAVANAKKFVDSKKPSPPKAPQGAPKAQPKQQAPKGTYKNDTGAGVGDIGGNQPGNKPAGQSDPEKINRLQGLGVPEAKAKELLAKHKGNVEAAATEFLA